MKLVTDDSILNQLNDEPESKQNNEQPDYTHQSERGIIDSIRDLAYGAIHGPWEMGKMGGNLITGGHLEEIPGYKQYIPFIEKHIESIKSPKASPTGDLLQLAGEIGLPGGIAVKIGKKALEKVLEKYPIALTEKRATKGLRELGEEAAGVGGKAISPEVSHDVMDLMAHPSLLPARNHVSKLLSEEGYNSAYNLQSLLGTMTRELGRFGGNAQDKIAAQMSNMNRQKVLEDIMKYLEENAGIEKGAKLRKEQTRYKNYKKLQKNVYEPAKKVALPFGVGYEVLHRISKLLGG